MIDGIFVAATVQNDSHILLAIFFYLSSLLFAALPNFAKTWHTPWDLRKTPTPMPPKVTRVTSRSPRSRSFEFHLLHHILLATKIRNMLRRNSNAFGLSIAPARCLLVLVTDTECTREAVHFIMDGRSTVAWVIARTKDTPFRVHRCIMGSRSLRLSVRDSPFALIPAVLL